MFQSKQVKKNDVFFYLFLILLVVAIVGVTVFLIYDKNRTSHLDDLENTDSNDFDVSYFQFEEVSEAPVMDAFKEYAYNPIEIEYVNHRVVNFHKSLDLTSYICNNLNITTVTKRVEECD